MSFTCSVDIIGLDTTLDMLTRLNEDTPKAMETAIERVAMYFRDNCVLFAQAGHPDHPNVITGRLSGSMRYDMLKGGTDAMAQIGSDVDYAPYVEFGHMSKSWGHDVWHYVPAYPWFQPAVMQTFDSGDAQIIFDATMHEILRT